MIFKTFLKRLFPRSFDEQIYNLTPKELIIRKSSNHGGFKFGLFLLTVIFLFAIFGPVILDVSPYEQDLTKRLLPPVWKEGGTGNMYLEQMVMEEIILQEFYMEQEFL